MTRIALVLALTSAGCAHKQLSNQQVAKVALYAGGYIVIMGALVLWCHQGCNTK